MLKPIHKLPCSPALAACQRLMRNFALWLCDPSVSAASITHAALQPNVAPTAIETDWLWNFLQRKNKEIALLAHAQSVAGLGQQDKVTLRSWIQAVSALLAQFQTNSPAWPPLPAIPDVAWQSFKNLMLAFYEKGLRSGLPYLANGTPVVEGGVTYAEFVRSFRHAHRLTQNEDAREVCVLCGGPLDVLEVDHWVAEAKYPLLSVCADNLLPICGRCNSTDNKGWKPVYDASGFADWFHPYLRHANGGVRLDYVLPTLGVKCAAANTEDGEKVENLDRLLNLSERWTREFKAEYAKQQDVLRRREAQRKAQQQPRQTLQEVARYVQQWAQELLPSEPHHEVHAELGRALQELARTQSWLDELAAV